MGGSTSQKLYDWSLLSLDGESQTYFTSLILGEPDAQEYLYVRKIVRTRKLILDVVQNSFSSRRSSKSIQKQIRQCL